MTVSYVKDRHQFGRPIGSFQAVQHQLADVLIALQAAELATEQALATTSHQGDPLVAEVSSEVAIAASLVAFREATLTAHQLHGGIGFVSEHPLHCYSDRYLFLSAMLGGEQASYARLGPKVLQRRDNQGFF
jgi:acyl-CoA dehydrogenase